MSSTVTTTSISVLTTAVNLEGLSQALIFVALAALAMVLLAKEITVASSSRSLRTLARGLDIGVVPLLMVFGLIVVLNLFSYFSGS